MNQIRRLLKRDWPYFSGLAALFVLSIIVGYNLSSFAPQVARDLEKQTIAHLSEVAKMMKGAGLPTQIYIIWLNNMIASCTAIIMGALLIPFLSLVLLIGNGLVIGLMQQIFENKGIHIAQFYLSLLPHGIFEIPAFLIAVYLGARFSLIPYRLVWHYFKARQYRPLLKEYLHDFKYYGMLLVGLLAIAATIEMAVTPLLIKL